MQEGYLLSLVDVDAHGTVDPEHVRDVRGKATCVVSVMHANEIPMSEIGFSTRKSHVDRLLDWRSVGSGWAGSLTATFASTQAVNAAVAATAERHIREHLDQWCIFRPLWAAGAEQAEAPTGEGRRAST